MRSMLPVILMLMMQLPRMQAQDTLLKVSSGVLHRYVNFKSSFVAERNVDVWLPESYNSSERYDVLYMHDGQNLFDTASCTSYSGMEWLVDEALSKNTGQHRIPACIVVGIWSTSGRRPEYFPQRPFEMLDTSIQNKIRADIKGNPVSDSYLRFIVHELKPFIDSVYSTHRDRKHTHMAGSSMGGLISLYAICEYPKIFGSVAGISTHWVGCPNYRNDSISQQFIKYIGKKLPSPRTHAIYIDRGTTGLDAQYEIWQKNAEAAFQKKGYNELNFRSEVIEGTGHHEQFWSSRFGDIAAWLLSHPGR